MALDSLFPFMPSCQRPPKKGREEKASMDGAGEEEVDDEEEDRMVGDGRILIILPPALADNLYSL